MDREQDPLAPQRLDRAICWLIWRQGEKTRFRSLAAAEARAIDSLRSGADFATLCAGLCDRMTAEAAAHHAAGFIHRWLSGALIVRAEVS